MYPSLARAAQMDNAPLAQDYRVLRYEDLVADRPAVMRELAQFLGIENVPALLEPTTFGDAAIRNSSFKNPSDAGKRSLTRAEERLVSITLGNLAGDLGYDELRPRGWVNRCQASAFATPQANRSISTNKARPMLR